MSGKIKEAKRILARVVRGFLSPTRGLFKFLKPVDKDAAAAFIRLWHLSFFFAAPFIWCGLLAVDAGDWSIPRPVSLCLCLLAISRINEVFYAFLTDGLDRLKGAPEQSALTPYERILLISRSYLELIVDFGILYYLGFRDAFSPHSFKNVVEAVYFSAMTITTVGYGDLAPSEPASQLLATYEVLGGIVLIVLAFGAYVSKAVNQTGGREDGACP